MNFNFDFNNPTRILFGSGKLEELGDQAMPGKKAMVIISNGKSTAGGSDGRCRFCQGTRM